MGMYCRAQGWGCRETAAKPSKAPPARKHPRDTICSPTVSKAVPDAPGYMKSWEMGPLWYWLRQERGSPGRRGAPKLRLSILRGSSEGRPTQHPQSSELHASAVLAVKLQAMRGRNKSKTKHLSKYPFPVACTVMQFFQSHGLCGSGGQFHALTPA